MSKKFSYRLSFSKNLILIQLFKHIKNPLCIIILAFLPFLLFGCEWFSGNVEFYKLEVPPEKTHEIETLDLKEIQEPNVPEINEQPPSELEITLEQSRAMTLENNLELKVQLISPSIAVESVSIQEAQFEAAFFSNVSYAKFDTPTSTTLTGSSVDNANADLGVRVPMRTGGTLTFDFADARTKTNNIFSTLNPAYESDASVSLSQPLLRGAGKRTNTYAIRIAEYDKQITDARTKLEVIRIIADIDRVYWRLYAARKELEVRKQQYDLAEALLEQAQRLVEAGEQPQVEIIRAEAGVAQQLGAIITAENNVRDRERELKRMINKPGLSMQSPTILIPATEPGPVHYKFDKQKIIEIAFENRMELLELEFQIAQDVSSIDYMHNQALPLVTMDYTYNINGLGPTQDQSWDLLREKRFEDHRFGLQLLVPLGNEAAKSGLRQAFYQRRQRIASHDSRKELIELEVLNAIDQLEANWQSILASRQSTILDGRLFEAEKRQFSLGLRTSTDVLLAQTSFADSQSAEILAITDYEIALVDIAQATGTLLGAAKVRWEPIVPETNF